MSTHISLKDVTKTYQTKEAAKGLLNLFRPSQFKKNQALKKITFQLKAGERVGLLGRNGAGKSTLIKLLCGLLYPTSGQINVLGHVPSQQNTSFLKDIGVVFGQRNALWWDLPVIDSLRAVRYIYHLETTSFQERLQTLIACFEIAPILKRPVRVLSLGERVKCEVISTLLHRPKILLLDEPTLGLDLIAKNELRQQLLDFSQQNGMSIVLTSHDMSDLVACCERIILLDMGALCFDGDIQAFHDQYCTHIQVVFKASYGLFDPRLKETIRQIFSRYEQVSQQDTETLLQIGIPKQLQEADISALASLNLTAQGIVMQVKQPSLEEVIFNYFQRQKQHEEAVG